jgi:hypothetical protein
MKKIIIFLLLISWITPTYAHRSPEDCTGSGLGVNLYTSTSQVYIGESISYSVGVYNGITDGPISCDATDILVSLITPDGVDHPITLSRTTLTNGQADYYPSVVTYVSRSQDITVLNTLKATVFGTGTIHQNETNSIGGSNQGVNTEVLTAPSQTTTPSSTPTSTPSPVSSPVYTPPTTPTATPTVTPIGGGGGGGGGFIITPTPEVTPQPFTYFPNTGLPPSKTGIFWSILSFFGF